MGAIIHHMSDLPVNGVRDRRPAPLRSGAQQTSNSHRYLDERYEYEAAVGYVTGWTVVISYRCCTAVCVSIDRFVQNRSKFFVYLLIVLEPGTPAPQQ